MALEQIEQLALGVRQRRDVWEVLGSVAYVPGQQEHPERITRARDDRVRKRFRAIRPELSVGMVLVGLEHQRREIGTPSHDLVVDARGRADSAHSAGSRRPQAHEPDDVCSVGVEAELGARLVEPRAVVRCVGTRVAHVHEQLTRRVLWHGLPEVAPDDPVSEGDVGLAPFARRKATDQYEAESMLESHQPVRERRGQYRKREIRGRHLPEVLAERAEEGNGPCKLRDLGGRQPVQPPVAAVLQVGAAPVGG